MKTRTLRQQKLSEFGGLREIQILREIGLSDDEIEYLVWLKSKENKRSHWK